jgi:hypothetical protein
MAASTSLLAVGVIDAVVYEVPLVPDESPTSNAAVIAIG